MEDDSASCADKYTTRHTLVCKQEPTLALPRTSSTQTWQPPLRRVTSKLQMPPATPGQKYLHAPISGLLALKRMTSNPIEDAFMSFLPHAMVLHGMPLLLGSALLLPPLLSIPDYEKKAMLPRESPSPLMISSKKMYVLKACVNCKSSHVACNAARPCQRCVRLGKHDSCVDAERKKRGRPPLNALRDSQQHSPTPAIESRSGNGNDTDGSISHQQLRQPSRLSSQLEQLKSDDRDSSKKPAHKRLKVSDKSSDLPFSYTLPAIGCFRTKPSATPSPTVPSSASLSQLSTSDNYLLKTQSLSSLQHISASRSQEYTTRPSYPNQEVAVHVDTNVHTEPSTPCDDVFTQVPHQLMQALLANFGQLSAQEITDLSIPLSGDNDGSLEFSLPADEHELFLLLQQISQSLDCQQSSTLSTLSPTSGSASPLSAPDSDPHSLQILDCSQVGNSRESAYGIITPLVHSPLSSTSIFGSMSSRLDTTDSTPTTPLPSKLCPIAHAAASEASDTATLHMFETLRQLANGGSGFDFTDGNNTCNFGHSIDDHLERETNISRQLTLYPNEEQMFDTTRQQEVERTLNTADEHTMSWQGL